LNQEKNIWINLKAGEVSSLKDLYDEYYQTLYNFGRRMTTDILLIEDAIQDTFLAIWKYKATTAVPANIKQYLIRVFRNQLLKLLKDRMSGQTVDDSHSFQFEVAIDELIIEGESVAVLKNKLNKALAELTDRQREIIYYRFYENFSFEEIAVIMNMQTRATYKLTARALAALRVNIGSRLFYLLLLAEFRLLAR
jgi:RNA polymerase sigma factor (sigma-70 family)